jgi:hypothetical protein
MVTLLWNPLRRWWMTSFDAAAPVAAVSFRRPAVRSARLPLPTVGRPVTPFRVATAGGSVQGARRAARRFWMTLDPQDRRRGAIGGSFAEVCAALERLAAVEERMRG